MIHVGGHSYHNGIKFSARNYTVRFKTDSDSTHIYLRKNKKERKFLDFMYNIPLLRGIALSIQDFPFVSLAIILNFVMIGNTGKSITITIPLPLLLVILLFIIFLKRKKIRFAFQYHGAEHKVIFTNYAKKKITLKNCRNAPRVADNCGTMFVCSFFFCYIIIKIVISFLKMNLYPGFCMLISFCLAYEIFLMKRNTPVLRWLFRFGYLLQKYIFTIEPDNYQLEEAVKAFNLLEKAETGQLSNRELQELLNH